MPTWSEIDQEITAEIATGLSPAQVCDDKRKAYLANLSRYVDRPFIAYYSGFLQKPPHPELAITDFDINGFMAVIHGLERKKGLDLILLTPGGGIEATRALVEYLYQMVGKNIRVIVPQLAMSAGTMIACSSREIMLVMHSSFGPLGFKFQVQRLI